MTARKKKLIIIGGIALAVILAAAILLIILLGGKSKGPYVLSISTQAGFDTEKINEIRSIKGVSDLVGVCEQISDKYVIQSYPENLIVPELLEGREVQADNEVVVDWRYARQKDLQLGKKISLKIGNTSASYSIVGIAKPCFDLKSAKPFFYVNLSAFRADGYNRLYVDVARRSGIGPVEKAIKSMGYIGQKHRYEKLRKDIQGKINETEQLMETLFGPTEEALEEAKSQLENAEASLSDENAQQLADAKAQLDAAKEQLDTGRSQLDATKAKIDSSRAQLEQLKATLDQATETYNTALQQAGISESDITRTLNKLSQMILYPLDNMDEIQQNINILQTLQQTRLTIAQYTLQYQNGIAELEDAEYQYEAGEATYQESLAEYEKNKAEYDKQEAAFNGGSAEYTAKKAEYEKAQKEYLEQKKEYEQQIADYEEELDMLRPADWKIFRFGQDGNTLLSEDVVF